MPATETKEQVRQDTTTESETSEKKLSFEIWANKVKSDFLEFIKSLGIPEDENLITKGGEITLKDPSRPSVQLAHLSFEHSNMKKGVYLLQTDLGDQFVKHINKANLPYVVDTDHENTPAACFIKQKEN